jgi:hypothetical protein
MKLSITEVLLTLNNGGTVEQLQTEIRDVVAAVQDAGGTGTVTLKLSIKKNGDIGVLVSDSISSTKPKVKSADSMFFVTDDHSLTRKNPDQFTLMEANS